jgi:uncharacterized protein
MRLLLAAVLLVPTLAYANFDEPKPSAKNTQAQALVDSDRPGALKLFKEACAEKDGQACAKLGDLMQEDGKNKDAVSFYDKSCTLGWAYACTASSQIAFTGQLGARKDGKKSVAYLEKACKLKLDTGCESYGQAYLLALGVKADHKKALAIWEAACKDGSGRSCFQVGTIYRDGYEKIAADPAKAFPLLDAGCKLGSVGSCLNGGIMLANGDGVPADKARAKAMFTTGCAQKDVPELYAEIQKDLCERAKAK